MRLSTLIISLFVTSISIGQDFDVTPLLENGSLESRINIVVLGDGYTTDQLADFLIDAEGIKQELFNASPLKEYQDYFNIYAISVPSNESGAADDPASLIDNYFGSTFNFAGIQRLLVPTRNDKIVEVLSNNFPEYDQVLMIVNSTAYGGSGGWIATSSVNVAASEIAIHELGHSYANLSDEYWAGSQFAGESPNMTSNKSSLTIKWKSWLNDFGIGIIPHPEDPNWNKPHENCKMQFLNSPFCAVCKEQFIQITHELTSPIVEYSPIDAANSDQLTFDLTLIRPDPDELNISWILNDVIIETDIAEIALEASQLTESTNELIAVVFDETSLSRKDQLYVSRVKWTINSTISSEKTVNVEEKPDEVITAISDGPKSGIRVFPNPTANYLTLDYRLRRPGRVDVTILDISGKEVMKLARTKSKNGKHLEKVNLTALKPGQYILQLQGVEGMNTFRFIKE